jgi:predicted Rossmann fold nucleotide-binding protein DprA/Smf involved in DNA uptake
MAVPGRVDSAASIGTHELLKEGAAALVTDPADVLAVLETPARHAHGGTHVHRYAADVPVEPDLFAAAGETAGCVVERRAAAGAGGPVGGPAGMSSALPLSAAQGAIIAALAEPLTVDELSAATGLSPAELRSEVTILEIQRRIVRQGSRLARG